MKRGRRDAAAGIGIAWLAAPASARAEVSDKIPGAGSLLLANVVLFAVTALVVGVARRFLAPRLVVLGLLTALSAAIVVELRFSDVSDAVTSETGGAYVALAWMLVLIPVLGIIALVSRSAMRSPRHALPGAELEREMRSGDGQCTRAAR